MNTKEDHYLYNSATLHKNISELRKRLGIGPRTNTNTLYLTFTDKSYFHYVTVYICQYSNNKIDVYYFSQDEKSLYEADKWLMQRKGIKKKKRTQKDEQRLQNKLEKLYKEYSSHNIHPLKV